MPQSCPRCKRANPDEATYCYFDGFVLQQGAVVSPLGQLSREFVFPLCGKRCRSVEEIAQTCQVEWDEARDLLRRGDFERHFGQSGRLDLSRTAQEAQENPDPDVALLQFINNLPVSPNLQAPRLDLTPRRIALGALKAGEQRQMKLTVLNHGKGLLQGKVAVSDGEPWLKLTDGIDPELLSRQGGARPGRDGACRFARPCGRSGVQRQADGRDQRRHRRGAAAARRGRRGVHTAAVPGRDQPARHGRAHAHQPETGRAAAGERRGAALVRGATAGSIPWRARRRAASAPCSSSSSASVCRSRRRSPLSESEMRFRSRPPRWRAARVALRTTTKKWVFAQVESDAAWLRPTKPSVSGPQQAPIGFEIDPAQMDGRPQQEATLRVFANGGQRLALKVRVAVQFPRGFVPAAAAAPGHAAAWYRGRCRFPQRPLLGPHRPRAAVAGIGPRADGHLSPRRRLFRSGRRADDLPLPPPPSALQLGRSHRPRRRRSTGCRRPTRSRRCGESVGVRVLRPLVVGVVLALVFRLVLAVPAEVFARVLVSKATDPAPGSLECWKHSPLERGERRQRPRRAFPQVVRARDLVGRWSRRRVPGVRGAVALVRICSSAASPAWREGSRRRRQRVSDGRPRRAAVRRSRRLVTTADRKCPHGWRRRCGWLLAAFCWAAYGAGLGYLLCAFGAAGAARASPLAGRVGRGSGGWRRMAGVRCRWRLAVSARKSFHPLACRLPNCEANSLRARFESASEPQGSNPVVPVD